MSNLRALFYVNYFCKILKYFGSINQTEGAEWILSQDMGFNKHIYCLKEHATIVLKMR